MKKEIKLPKEVEDRIRLEALEVTRNVERSAKDFNIALTGKVWKDRFIKQIQSERATAYFREQELLNNQKLADGWYIIPHFDYSKWMAYFVDGIMIISTTNGILKIIDEVIKLDECNPLKRLATPEEVTERLTEFVNKEGYKEGVKVFWEVKPVELKGSVSFSENKGYYAIYIGRTVIWSSIKGWAKIIEEPKFTVEPFRTFGVNILKNGKDLEDGEREQLAKEIETFLNSKSCEK